MSNSSGQYRNGVSINGAGVHITDTSGYRATISPSGTATFVDNMGHSLNIGSSSVGVNYNIGNSSLSINTNKELSLTTRFGLGTVKTVSQINPNGSVSIKEISISASIPLSIAGKAIAIENGVEVKWTPDTGWTSARDGVELSFYGYKITDLADAAYISVEESNLGQTFATRDEWINSGSSDSHAEWLRKRNQSKIDPETNRSFLSAVNAVERRDPLSLDLDGDGIETVSANSGITFDFDGDGLKTGTGWVRGDDGFLVLDRNGNGTIDNGSELFGVDTVKSNGQKATDGFDALRDLDSNGDGVFDAQDAAFSDVRIWQDLNQDGIAQSSELKSLADHHISAINLGSSRTSQNSNGNLISAVGSFVRDDGQVGTVNGNQSLAANLDLASNPFYREYTDEIAIDESVAALPNMQGSGAVRDLREAAMLSPQLSSKLAIYSQAESRADQRALLGQLVAAWASSSGFRTFDQRIGDLAAGKNYELAFSYSWEIERSNDAVSNGSSNDSGSVEAGSEFNSSPGPTAEQLEKKALLEMVKVLEVFNNQSFFNFTPPAVTQEGERWSFSMNYRSGSQSHGARSSREAGQTFYITEEDLSFASQQADSIRAAYQTLLDSVYNGLLLQTRLKPYVDAISLTLDSSGIQVDYSGVSALADQVAGQDVVKAISDVLDLQRLGAFGENLPVKLSSVSLPNWLEQLSTAEQQALKGEFGPTLLLGGAGADSLSGTALNDQLFGGAGDDLLDGGTGSNRLFGGSGNDTLRVSTSALDNLFVGGAGNDLLYGSHNSDTYLFNLGDGIDTIYETGSNAGAIDVLRFGEGIKPEDIQTRRSGTDLIFAHVNGTDQVIVKGVFAGSSATSGIYNSALIERIEFADGTALTWAQITQQGLVQHGTAGNDTMIGYSGTNHLYGGDGNDTLQVSTSAPDNLFVGGAGNDLLYGSHNSDTYLFNLGDGIDTIYETGSNAGAIDILRFGEGINPEDIQTRRSGTDLVFAHVNGTDQVIVKGVFAGSSATSGIYNSALIERIEFADGTALTWAQITQQGLVQHGTDGNDTMAGYSGTDEIHGGAGNDIIDGGTGTNRLYGGDGNDTLQVSTSALDNLFVGGAGNDLLYGSHNSDTYLFNLGDGIDTIYETGSNAGAIDVLRFGEGIKPEDIQTRRSGTNLIFAHVNGTDQVIVKGVFAGSSVTSGINYIALIERIEFADGTALTWAQITQQGLVQHGTAGNDTMIGYSGINHLYGGDGNDTLQVSTSALDNLFVGGAGNDLLYGSHNSDTYLFNLGDGIDTIYETGSNAGAIDVLRFGEGIKPEDIQTRRSGADLVFAHVNGTDKVIVKGVFTGTAYATDGIYSSALIERIEFADGTALTWARLVQHGTAGNDTMIGYSGIDEIHGGAGNDIIDGGTGTNSLYGGDGNDTLKVSTTALNNLFVGGAGNDLLYGSHNSDTYLFNLGDGIDTIYETGSNAGAIDILRFGEGIKPEDIQTRRSGTDLIFAHVNGTDQVIVKGVFTNNSATSGIYNSALIERIEFADGTALTWAQIIQQGLVQHGTAGNDTMIGYSGINHLYGGDGNDTLQVSTSALNNLFVGGVGNDMLFGSHNSDTYLFNLGDGIDTIYETGSNAGAIDILRFGEGIKPEDIQTRRSGTDLIFAHVNGTDQVIVKGVFTSNSATSGIYNSALIERIEFADGTALTWAQIIQQGLVQHGTAGNDTMIGYSGINRLYGGDGNDTLQVSTSALNNLFVGGAGNDLLYGSHNSDTYLFNLGDGVDTIYETGSNAGATDVLRFGEGIGAEQVWLGRNGNDLQLQLLGTEDQVFIRNWYSSTSSQVEQFQLNDGRALSSSQVNNLVNAMAAFGSPAGGEVNLSAPQREQLDQLIAANWQ